MGRAVGLVVAIEGMEGAGKTTALHTTAGLLTTIGWRVVTVDEFSASPLGDYLQGRLRADRFLRDPDRTPTAWTQVFSVAADTAFALEYTTAELRASYDIVLKDRYRESLVACQHVAVADEYGMTDAAAHDAVAAIASRLPDPADIVVWLDVPADERQQRLYSRGDFVPGDEHVLRRREASYRRLIGQPGWSRKYRFVDGTGDQRDVATRIVAIVTAAMAR